MSDIIRLLPDSVANQIAAGEVIQRPASVIKELVENAVDAGAQNIRIYIKDAGRTLIQVIDDGKGMSETDARMAFERHATSKIRRADDLFTLSTMGFRGEALPSICAISQVEVRTCTPEASVGTRLVINGSKVESQEPVMCEKGTSISVKNLFFNVPARRKFLKSDNVELSNIMREFERLALVNNEVRMSIDTGTRSIDLRKGNFKQRITDLWKTNMALINVNIETPLVKISGYVSRPESARRRNFLQFLIVNGRNMRHHVFHKAILSCYESLIATDTQPNYFIKFEVDPATIDVNISPTKNEIKFENEQEIRSMLHSAVKASLGKHGAMPDIDFNTDPLEVRPLPEGMMPEAPDPDYNPGYNPFNLPDHMADTHSDTPDSFAYPAGSLRGGVRNLGNLDSRQQSNRQNWSSLYNDFMNQAHRTFGDMPEESQVSPQLPDMPEDEDTSSPCLQFGLKYIVTTSREGIIIIDQHRAHVRVLYEEIMAHTKEERPASQHVLFPELLTLDGTMQAAFHEVEDELKQLGFLLQPHEEGTWSINAVPALGNTLGRGADSREVIMRILESVTEDSANYGKEATKEVGDSLLTKVALMMARASAIERGRRLSQSEMEKLTADLFRLPDPLYTPNGNTIYTILDESRLTALLP